MNDKFPGRPDYVGPTKGYFGLLDRTRLFEISDDVMKHVEFVRANYHDAQDALHNMIYLDPVLCPAAIKRQALDEEFNTKCKPFSAEYHARRAALDAEYKTKLIAINDEDRAKRAPTNADYKAKRAPIDAEILAYIRSHIPDFPWPWWNKG